MKKIILLLSMLSLFLVSCSDSLKIRESLTTNLFEFDEKELLENYGIKKVESIKGSFSDASYIVSDAKFEIKGTASKKSGVFEIGDKILLVIEKANKEYTYTLYKGIQILESKKTYDLDTNTLDNLLGNRLENIWSITANDLEMQIETPQQLYTRLKELKLKSNSPAMNYLFDAILETEELEGQLRDEILTTLSGNLPQGATEYDYAENLFKTPASSYKVLTTKGLVALQIIAKNLELAYLTGETVKLDKTQLTDGYNVILTPAHFKAMSGAFKTFIAQIHLIASYKFSNNDDLVKFIDFVENLGEEPTDVVAFLRDDFVGLDVMNADTDIQAKAQNYMLEGAKELLEASRELPTVIGRPNKDSLNMLALPVDAQQEIEKVLTEANNLLKVEGAVVEISKDGKKANATVALRNLYTLDIKALITELTAGTKDITDEILLKEKLNENMNKSTFGGILPQGLPEEFKVQAD